MIRPLPPMSCRKCGRINPTVYLAPVVAPGSGTCICIDCAQKRGWLDANGDLKPGITL